MLQQWAKGKPTLSKAGQGGSACENDSESFISQSVWIANANVRTEEFLISSKTI